LQTYGFFFVFPSLKPKICVAGITAMPIAASLQCLLQHHCIACCSITALPVAASLHYLLQRHCNAYCSRSAMLVALPPG
jgi:hypothetical protein